QPLVEVRADRRRSGGPDSRATSGSWSLICRPAIKRSRRPNPAVIRGALRSVIVGGDLAWEAQRVRATMQPTNEAAAFDVGDRRFVQSTLHGEIHFPTFAAQEFWLTTHLVHTFGDTAPPQ